MTLVDKLRVWQSLHDVAIAHGIDPDDFINHFNEIKHSNVFGIRTETPVSTVVGTDNSLTCLVDYLHGRNIPFTFVYDELFGTPIITDVTVNNIQGLNKMENNFDITHVRNYLNKAGIRNISDDKIKYLVDKIRILRLNTRVQENTALAIMMLQEQNSFFKPVLDESDKGSYQLRIRKEDAEHTVLYNIGSCAELQADLRKSDFDYAFHAIMAATKIRLHNSAITELIDHTEKLKAYWNNSFNNMSVLGTACHFIEPHYSFTELTLDSDVDMNISKIHKTVLREAQILYKQSGLKELICKYPGRLRKPNVVIMTDPNIARIATSKHLEYGIFYNQTLDLRMQGKMLISLSVEDDLKEIMPSAEEQALNDEVAMLLSILNFGYTAIRLPEITKDEKHDLLGFIPQYRYICNMPLMAEVNVHFDKSEE